MWNESCTGRDYFRFTERKCGDSVVNFLVRLYSTEMERHERNGRKLVPCHCVWCKGDERVYESYKAMPVIRLSISRRLLGRLVIEELIKRLISKLRVNKMILRGTRLRWSSVSAQGVVREISAGGGQNLYHEIISLATRHVFQGYDCGRRTSSEGREQVIQGTWSMCKNSQERRWIFSSTD